MVSSEGHAATFPGLLFATIGAMRRTEGKIRVYGTVAYIPQNPWYAQTTSFIRVFAHYAPKIMGGKAKDNILFSHQSLVVTSLY